MTVISSNGTKKSQGGRNSFLLAFAAVLVVLIVAAAYSSGGRSDASKAKPQKGAAAADRSMEDTKESVAIEGCSSEETPAGDDANSAGLSKGCVPLPSRSTFPAEALPYLHCGPKYASDSKGTELILLHGAKFTKEDWRTSGILAKLCDRSGGELSATALDLSVRADGPRLGDAFDALAKAGVISGDPATFVTPSASGKAMVSLGEWAAKGDGSGPEKLLISRIVKSWIPVACPAIRDASEMAILSFQKYGKPIFAIYGTKDSMGKTVTKRLVDVAGAQELELEGSHPCYLDSPDDFIDNVLGFMGLKEMAGE